jgi:hypothetical protein
MRLVVQPDDVIDFGLRSSDDRCVLVQSARLDVEDT